MVQKSPVWIYIYNVFTLTGEKSEFPYKHYLAPKCVHLWQPLSKGHIYWIWSKGLLYFIENVQVIPLWTCIKKELFDFQLSVLALCKLDRNVLKQASYQFQIRTSLKLYTLFTPNRPHQSLLCLQLKMRTLDLRVMHTKFSQN